jgi:tetrahydromethanopterin S-methyltransferase subunit C
VDPQLHEIVDLAQVDLAMVYLALAAPVLGIIIGAVVGRLRDGVLYGIGRGLAFGMLGPIIFVMWRFYRYMVRCDPASGYVGLHKMSVFALNVCVFAIVGLLLGALYGKLIAGRPPRPAHDTNQTDEASPGN